MEKDFDMKKSLLSIVFMASLVSGYAQAETVDPEQNVANTRKLIEKVTEKQTNTVKKAEKAVAATKNTTVKEENSAAAQSQNATVVLQLGVFTDPGLAYKQAAKVSMLGVPAKVVHIKKKNGNTMRVVRSSARFPQAEAERVAADLREQQVNPILMSQ